MKKILSLICVLGCALVASAQGDPVKLTVSGKTSRFNNGLINFTVSDAARVSVMKGAGATLNMLSTNGVYFDYTAEKNAALKPDKFEVIRQDDDYAEVLYSNTTSAVRMSQGFIVRRGECGFYTYILMEGTATPLKIREARVCVRAQSNFLNGYVDDSMNGKIPSVGEMSAAENDPDRNIQDATYRLNDGSIYTKYDWAQYVVNDSVHGLMNDKNGIWNIACSHEWLNGGPMRQELTVHATGKSPITIQMLQGEHFGASAMTLAEGQKILYGPFFVYVNGGESTDAMIADAKAMASAKQAEWPFEWFVNENYPLDRATVSGQLTLTNGMSPEGMQVVLAAPGKELYQQTGGYMFTAKADENGYFAIPNVRKGDYSLYAYATKGIVTDELEKKDISVSGDTDLGTIRWEPVTLESQLWNIGENNRMSDGFRLSEQPRSYGHWEGPEANLTYVIGESTPENNWYYAQTKNGKWTIEFNLDRAYEGSAILTASVAGATNNPRIAVEVNGKKQANWSFYNDAGIYRSAILGGRHSVRTVEFPASELKVGKNTITLTQSGIGRNGGVHWDCVKLEAGAPIDAGAGNIAADTDSTAPVSVYTLTGANVGTFDSLDEFSNTTVAPGLYIYRQGTRSGKIVR